MTHIEIYTDGACSGNPGRGGCAFVILIDGILHRSSGYGYHLTTNNRMEILAACFGLIQAREEHRRLGGGECRVTVYSDSQLLVKTMTEGWTRKTNLDLWDELDRAVRDWDGAEITFVKVKGHAGSALNNKADEIAVKHSATPLYHDTVYEQTHRMGPGITDAVPAGEPEIVSIRLLGVNTPDNRSVEVELSNGTVVSILPVKGTPGGFQQCGCTATEAHITVDVAWKYKAFINGGKL